MAAGAKQKPALIVARLGIQMQFEETNGSLRVASPKMRRRLRA